MAKTDSGSFWAFGFVEVKEKAGSSLQLCEVYFNKKKPWAFCSISWKNFRKDRKMILKDIRSQTRLGCEFYFQGRKLIMKRRRIGKRKAKR